MQTSDLLQTQEGHEDLMAAAQGDLSEPVSDGDVAATEEAEDDAAGVMAAGASSDSAVGLMPIAAGVGALGMAAIGGLVSGAGSQSGSAAGGGSGSGTATGGVDPDQAPPAVPVDVPTEPTGPTEPTEPDVPAETLVPPAEVPVAPDESPLTPDETPTTPAEEPAAPAEEPMAPAEAPTAPAEEPTVPQEEPTVPEEEPSIPAEQPTAPAEEPSEPEEPPTTPVEPPVPPTDETPVTPDPVVIPVNLSAPRVFVARGSGVGTSEDPMLINAQGALGVETDGGTEWLYSTDGGETWKLGAASELDAADLLEGLHSLQVIQRDAAGNVSPATVVEVERDTLAPDAPLAQVLEGSGSGADIDPMLISGRSSISVQAEEGAQWQYSVDGGQTWRVGTEAGILAADLAEGHGSVQLQQVDRAGNVSERTTLAVTKDSLVDTLTVTLSNVVGYDAGGRPIVDWDQGGQLHFGRLEAGATIQYHFAEMEGWADLGTADVVELASLAWGQGAMKPSFRQVDAFGNVSETTSLDYFFDRVGVHVQIATPAVQVTAVSNAAGETVTFGDGDYSYFMNDAGSLTVVPGDTVSWRYSLDDGATWQVGTDGGISPTEFVPNMNTILLVAVDRAGNESAATRVQVVLDNTPPDAPVVHVDRFQGGPVLNGDDRLMVDINAMDTWQFSLDGGQTWMVGKDIWLNASDLQEGLNHVQIVEFDQTGNASAVTSLEVTKDTSAARLGYTITGLAGLDSSQTPVYTSTSGTISLIDVESGAHVEMRNGTTGTWTDLGTATAYSLGDLGLTQDATNVLYFRQVDAVGNISEERDLALLYLPSSVPELPWTPPSVSVWG